MPLYEYHCGHCGRFEIIHKFADSPLKVCPTCGRKVQKLFSAPAIQFKGTGWYVTDYARKPSQGDGHSEGTAASSKEASSKEQASRTPGGTTSKDGAASGKDGAASGKAGAAASKDASTAGSSPNK